MAEAASRGRLTIYLGAAPGVGKTYAMLERGQALRQQGVDLVVGIALTHGRSDTAALLDGLECIPERQVTDQGASVSEFDLAATLKRRPRLVLLDELAHSNAPGSRHAKRWQDADELLDAGIDVLTTLNVQHIESLREPVARLTGVDVRERVPDRVLERADAIELVDLPSEELLARLRAGKVYLGDGAERALHGFFTPENLAGLRELALRYVAGRVQARQAAGGLAPGRQPAERLLVAIGPSPTSARLIRATKRMADATGATWLAVHAETPASLHLDAAARARIGEHLRLAESLGGLTLTVGGDDPADALIEAARRQGARRILVGKPAQGRLRDLWRGSLVHDLIRRSGNIEVLAITGDPTPNEPRPAQAGDGAPQTGARWWMWATAILAVIAALGIAFPLRGRLEPANLTLPFLLAVVAVALQGHRGPVIVATVLGVALFDVCCVPPYGSFAVSDTEYLLTFSGMLVVGITIAHLVARLRRQADHALSEAEGAAALHRLGGALAGTRGQEAVVALSNRLSSEILGCSATVLVTDQPGATTMTTEAVQRLVDDGSGIGASELAVAQWVAHHGQPAGLGTDTLPAARGLHLPLQAGTGLVGVLVLTGISTDRTRDPAWRRLAEAIGRLVALAIDCERLAQQAISERTRAEQERLRATLLAGVSHDLRTPLTAIGGLAQQLTDDPDPERRQTAQTIVDQAERLAAIVRNLLELTRLSSGTVRPRRVALAAEDAIAAAIEAMQPRCGGRRIQVVADPTLALSVDENLIHAALVNLIDNALVHGAGDIEITAALSTKVDRVDLTVADRGPGVPDEERERIFDPWQRGRGAAPGGAGLGLALVRAIMRAHGGDVRVDPRSGGGAAFTCTVPRHADP
jgi:two-component system sensor histidine kinase KdpD